VRTGPLKSPGDSQVSHCRRKQTVAAKRMAYFYKTS